MLIFNELRIDSNKNLIIDASVLDLTIDPDKEIGIDNLKIGYNSNTEVDEYTASDIINIADRYEGDVDALRGFRISIDLTKSPTTDTHPNAAANIIYVYISVNVPASVSISQTDCSDPIYIEGYAYDKCLLMNKVFDYIKATDGTCDNLDNYANYIVKVNGLQLAVESGNFTLALTYWNKFFANNSSNIGLISNTGCGCRQ